jgi:NAD(P)-dependent dehydrogenase (short-subunit alcohol dehydrogenase family)
VITGGSGGIGLATAQRFVREGAYAFDIGHRQGELDKAEALVGDGVSTVFGGTTNGADLDYVFARRPGRCLSACGRRLTKIAGMAHDTEAIMTSITHIAPPFNTHTTLRNRQMSGS